MLRVASVLAVVACVLILVAQVSVIADLRAFEIQPLIALLGGRGLLYIALLQAGVLLLLVQALRLALGRGQSTFQFRTTLVLLVAWLMLVLWLLDWILFEKPLTVRMSDALVSQQEQQESVDQAVLFAHRAAGIERIQAAAANARDRDLSVMLARIQVNRPRDIPPENFGAILAEYGKRYDIDPTLTFAWAYIASFYGDGPAGPMPFFNGMNAETFRDLVQAHLPAWFIESRLRAALVRNDWLTKTFGEPIGFKLRYALQKANYDVSVSPLDYSVFSDLFIVLREYENQFPELSAGTSAVDRALADSYWRLKHQILLPPYTDPYFHPPLDPGFYDAHRKDLIDFGRAAVYKSLLDFDFAARTQTLVAAFFERQYQATIGREAWASLSPQQQMALQAYHRDILTTNVGRPGPNLYVCPELVALAPFAYVATEARADRSGLSRPGSAWLPSRPNYLWGAATFRLSNLAEAWRVTKGTEFLDRRPSETVPAAVQVLARNRSKY